MRRRVSASDSKVGQFKSKMELMDVHEKRQRRMTATHWAIENVERESFVCVRLHRNSNNYLKNSTKRIQMCAHQLAQYTLFGDVVGANTRLHICNIVETVALAAYIRVGAGKSFETVKHMLNIGCCLVPVTGGCCCCWHSKIRIDACAIFLHMFARFELLQTRTNDEIYRTRWWKCLRTMTMVTEEMRWRRLRRWYYMQAFANLIY